MRAGDMAEANYFIKSDYKSRDEPIYYDNRPSAVSDIIHQPEAYLFAAHLAAKYGADAIIDIGCGSARKLMGIAGVRRIGVDFGVNIDFCREKYPEETWLCADLETCSALDLDESIIRRSIIICADVIEHMGDPRNLLKLLAQLNRVALATIITTPERDLVRGRNDLGPPANPAHVREWNLKELSSLLTAYDLPPAFIGLTVNNNINLEKKTIIAVADRRIGLKSSIPPRDFRPLAIVASFNDSEIITEVVDKLLNDDIDVHVLDNWSDDGTYEIVEALSRIYSGLSIERFPDDRAKGFNWAATLDEKARIAAQHPGRWIIHHDSDEIRETPWIDISLRAGLWIADQCECNAVDFTVLDFRPTDSRFVAGCELEQTLTMFEFGRRPGHFVQAKVWKQDREMIPLSQSGGHDAQFPNRKVFPYKFILKHYPIRSPDHARKKIFRERRGRYSPELKARGWHTQYDRYSPEDNFLWETEDLIPFDDIDVRRDYLLELISGVGIVR